MGFNTTTLEGKNIIGSRWILKVKRNADGSLDRFKARLVAQGTRRPKEWIMMKFSHQLQDILL